VIPVGVKATDKDMEYPKIDEEFFANFKNKKILFSVGRLVERKGFAWFIQNVMPSIVKFEEDICYVIVGDGPLRGKLVRLIKALGLHDYIFLLGNIDDKKLRALYLLSHVFVMPNIQVPGDMEGFGIVALEASSMGLCTVASRLEGITDAIKHGRNGFLVEPENRNEFITTLMGLLRDSRTRKALGEKFRDFTLANYSWDRIINRYTTLFEQIVNDHKNTLNHARPQNQERID
jgi:glycosyltransferase involved in cell wall biosynthesis